MCLSRLKAHGFLEVIPVAYYPSPTHLLRHEFNLLTRKGVDYFNEYLSDLGSNTQLTYNPELRRSAPLTYDHTVKVNSAICAIVGAFRQKGGVVANVISTRRLRSLIRAKDGKTLLNDIEPDAVLIVRFPDKTRAYLLEVDAGTEVIRGAAASSFDEKIPKYGDYFSRRFKDDPLFTGLDQPQVLVVTTGLKRAINLKEATYGSGGRRSYWFTAFPFIEPPPPPKKGEKEPPIYRATDPVWMVPTLEGYQSLLPDSL